MRYVPIVMLAPRIVEYCKQPDDIDDGTASLGDQQPVAFNPPPMFRSMNRITVTHKFMCDMLP